MKIKLLIFYFFILCLLNISCELYKNQYYNNELKDIVDSNKTKWINSGIVNYTFNVSISDFENLTDIHYRYVHVTVNNSIITTDLDSGSYGDDEKKYLNDRIKTIDGYYELINDSISINAQTINISFNDTLYYPKSLHITKDKDHKEDSIFVDIDSFAKL
jgi:hypothetical protein